jgi:hypothetical protein
MLEMIVVKRRKAGWEWQVRDRSGTVLMNGRERRRSAAQYQGYRALFLLLAGGWKSTDITRREAQ